MLYRLTKEAEGPAVQPVVLSSLAAAGWTEKNLEDIMAARIELLLRETQLMVLAQERQWQEEADILALDEDATLYIFEIKRTQSDHSNLLQVIRYGQVFGQYSYENLDNLFRQYSRNPLASLATAHKSYFDLAEELCPARFNRKQKFVVVTAGIDLKTLDAIQYWRQNGLPIESITFHVYKHGDEFLLDLTSYSPTPDDYIGLISGDWVVNTCATYEKDAYQEMLTACKAAAYYDRKGAVDRIQKGDRVFLYHTGVGIIAGGRATKGVQVCDRGGNKDAEHYIPVQFDLQADPMKERHRCVFAWEINRALGTSHRFRGTAFSISKELADKAAELLRDKHRSGSSS